MAADEAFGAAFSFVPPTTNNETAPPPSPTSQVHPHDDEDFHLQMLQANQDEEYDSSNEVEVEDEDIGFGNADMYDVTELLEYGGEDTGTEEDDNGKGVITDKVINNLKHGCVAKNSLRSYTTALSTFLIYIFKFDRYLMHKSWIRSIKTFTYGIEDERKKFKAMRKTIMVLLKKADANCPPIDFPNYPVRHFIKYCLSLRSGKGQRLSTASYNNKRSALFHLFRMYSVKQSDQFLLELTTLMRGLKREIATEKQHGNGKIQTGKIPISFALYRHINEYFLKENTMESIFTRAFMCLTWNLVCRATNTVTIHLHHLAWADDCLSVYFAHMKNDQTGEKKRESKACLRKST